jgi:hypothetical protein
LCWGIHEFLEEKMYIGEGERGDEREAERERRARRREKREASLVTSFITCQCGMENKFLC